MQPIYLNFYLEGGTLYRFVHEINGAPSTEQPEPTIQLEMPREGGMLPFAQLFGNFFNHRDDLGRQQQLFFSPSAGGFNHSIETVLPDARGGGGED